MSAPNAYDYQGLYFDLGINLAHLGTVMLDVKPIPGISDAIDATHCVPYSSPNEEEFWVDGAVGERTAHLTLLYGLNIKDHARYAVEVLRNWQPAPIRIAAIEVFKFDGYSCVVARAATTPNLLEAHSRLSLLPHIDLFPDYKPHVTLAYVSGDEDCIQEFVERMDYLTGTVLIPHDVNYGER